MNRRGALTRDALFDAVAGLVIADPGTAVDSDTIIGIAGVTKRSFDYHFTSTDDLATRLICVEFDRAFDHVRARSTTRDPAVDNVIALVFEASFYLIGQPRFRAAVLLHARTRAMSGSPPQEVARWRAALTRLIEQAIAEGDIRDDTDAGAFGTHILRAWIAMQSAADPEATYTDLIDRTATLLRDTLGPAVVPDRIDYLYTYITRYMERHGDPAAGSDLVKHLPR